MHPGARKEPAGRDLSPAKPVYDIEWDKIESVAQLCAVLKALDFIQPIGEEWEQRLPGLVRQIGWMDAAGVVTKLVADERAKAAP